MTTMSSLQTDASTLRRPAPAPPGRMLALTLDADWAPRPGAPISVEEASTKTARCAAHAWRRPRISLGHAPTPTIADDEVLIRVRACGICGSDNHLCENDEDGYVIFSGAAGLPVILGHEFAGEVVETGKRVVTLRRGDAVAAESVVWCGLCKPCRSGAFNQCLRMRMIGFGVPGALAQYVAVKERCCWSLNDLRSACGDGDELFELGALLEPIGCSYNGLFVDGGGMRPGAYVAVYGAGPIGLAAIMLARAAGAAKIFAFDIREPRVKLAREMGADFAANPEVLAREGTSPAQVVQDLTQGQGADVQIEAAGAAPQTVPEIERAFAPNGKMIYLGRAGNVADMNLDTLVSQANQITGARGHAGRGTFPSVIRMLATGRIPAHHMITARFPLNEAPAAIERAGARNDGKVMVVMPMTGTP